MIDGRKVLGLVTARGGSRSLKEKNLRYLGDKTLLARVIESALACVSIDRLILSSDDPKIISAGVDAGCEAPFVRPPELATDAARSIDVAHHAVSQLAETFDAVALLQPTSPLVAPKDIDGCIERWHMAGASSCVTVSKVEKHPDWMYQLSADLRLRPLSNDGVRPPRRQDTQPVFALNGAVFVADRAWLMKSADFIGPNTVGYEMPKERSVDIDTPLDLIIAEAILKSTADGPV